MIKLISQLLNVDKSIVKRIIERVSSETVRQMLHYLVRLKKIHSNHIFLDLVDHNLSLGVIVAKKGTSGFV
jgi:hypothetical protein